MNESLVGKPAIPKQFLTYPEFTNFRVENLRFSFQVLVISELKESNFGSSSIIMKFVVYEGLVAQHG